MPDPARRGERAFARLSRRLLVIALIAFCAFLLDGAANNWSAVHLRTDHGAAPPLAAVAFTLFSLTLSLAGWALFGVGLAALAPTVLGAAPDAGDLPPAVAIAAVTTIGYLGSFTGPPAIGALAELTGLGLLVAVSALMVLLARPALARQHGGSR